MANSTPCLVCRRMADIRAGNNPYFVAEVETGYVVLGDYQFFRGYTLLLYKYHVLELHDLPAPVRLAARVVLYSKVKPTSHSDRHIITRIAKA